MAGPAEKYPQPGKPYGGWTPNRPTALQSRAGWGFGVVMWLWVLHRAKQDLPHMLGWEHPWDHGHGHGHGRGHDEESH